MEKSSPVRNISAVTVASVWAQLIKHVVKFSPPAVQHVLLPFLQPRTDVPKGRLHK